MGEVRLLSLFCLKKGQEGAYREHRVRLSMSLNAFQYDLERGVSSEVSGGRTEEDPAPATLSMVLQAMDCTSLSLTFLTCRMGLFLGPPSHTAGWAAESRPRKGLVAHGHSVSTSRFSSVPPAWGPASSIFLVKLLEEEGTWAGLPGLAVT